jgi:oligopeptide/dipeptide ABC transporter ATP-binding protein
VNAPALSVADLRVAFRTPRGPEAAVDRFSMELPAGRITALVGESGCGKSVAVHALLGLVSPRRADVAATHVRLDGRELLGLPERQLRRVRGGGIAVVFQEPGTALDPVFTVGQQLAGVIRRHRGARRGAARKLAAEALRQGGFPEPEQVLRAYPHQLSGGMQQLVMIAMAVAARPRVLIADEPTTALDVTTQALILQRLRDLRDTLGTSILLVSHDFGVVAGTCDRVMVMYCGRIVEEGPYARLHRAPRHPYTAGLLAAVPRISSAPGQAPPRTVPIPGQVPALSDLPAGCHFADRCDRVTAECRTAVPRLAGDDESRVACHHPLRDR